MISGFVYNSNTTYYSKNRSKSNICFDRSDLIKAVEYIIDNSKTMANELLSKDYKLISVGTDTHVILIDLANKNVTGKSAEKALEKAGWKVSDLDLVESNDAFAAQSLAVIRDLKIPEEKVNVNGGAIALGHPIGASGARILTTLLHEMVKRDSKKGLATLCIGGGMGIAMCLERDF